MDLEKYSISELNSLTTQIDLLLKEKTFEKYKPVLGTIFVVSEKRSETPGYVEFFKIVDYDIRESYGIKSYKIKVIMLEKNKTRVGLKLNYSDKKYIPLPKFDFWKKHDFFCLEEALCESKIIYEVFPTEKETGEIITYDFRKGRTEFFNHKVFMGVSGVEYDKDKKYFQYVDSNEDDIDWNEIYEKSDFLI